MGKCPIGNINSYDELPTFLRILPVRTNQREYNNLVLITKRVMGHRVEKVLYLLFVCMTQVVGM